MNLSTIGRGEGCALGRKNSNAKTCRYRGMPIHLKKHQSGIPEGQAARLARFDVGEVLGKWIVKVLCYGLASPEAGSERL